MLRNRCLYFSAHSTGLFSYIFLSSFFAPTETTIWLFSFSPLCVYYILAAAARLRRILNDRTDARSLVYVCVYRHAIGCEARERERERRKYKMDGARCVRQTYGEKGRFCTRAFNHHHHYCVLIYRPRNISDFRIFFFFLFGFSALGHVPRGLWDSYSLLPAIYIGTPV